MLRCFPFLRCCIASPPPSPSPTSQQSHHNNIASQPASKQATASGVPLRPSPCQVPWVSRIPCFHCPGASFSFPGVEHARPHLFRPLRFRHAPRRSIISGFQISLQIVCERSCSFAFWGFVGVGREVRGVTIFPNFVGFCWVVRRFARDLCFQNHVLVFFFVVCATF